MKDGKKTTEFWFCLAIAIAAMATGLMSPEDAVKIASLLSAMVTGIGYQSFRSAEKRAVGREMMKDGDSN